MTLCSEAPNVGASWIAANNKPIYKQDKAFAENLMLTVKIDDVAAFRNAVIEKQLPEKFGIKLGAITQQPYGKEVNIIDMAGVCWHFVQ